LNEKPSIQQARDAVFESVKIKQRKNFLKQRFVQAKQRKKKLKQRVDGMILCYCLFV
jgi:hypothetical protein